MGFHIPFYTIPCVEKHLKKTSTHLENLLRETGHIAKVGGWEFDVSTGEGCWTDEVARIRPRKHNPRKKWD